MTECLVVDGPHQGEKVKPFGVLAQSLRCVVWTPVDGPRRGRLLILKPEHIKPIAKREAKS